MFHQLQRFASPVNITEYPSKFSTTVFTDGEVASRRNMIFRTGKQMSDAMLVFKDLVHGAQMVVFEDGGFLKLIEATQLIVGTDIAKEKDLLSFRKPVLTQSNKL